MKSPIVPLLLVASLAVACRTDGETPKSAEPIAPKLAVESKAIPMAPILARPAEQATDAAKPAAPVTDSRDDRVTALAKEYDDAMSAYYAAIEAAMGDNKNPSQEEYQKIQEQVHHPDLKPFIDLAQKLIDEDATDLAALHAIGWLLENLHAIGWLLGNDQAPDLAPKLVALIEKHHMSRPEMGEMCGRLAQHGLGVLEKLIANSPHKEVRGRACMALTEGLKNDIEIFESMQTMDPKEREALAAYFGEVKLGALATLDVKQTEAKIEALYERVVSEFADVTINAGTKRETTLGKQAGSVLFEINNLAVGKPSPEIEGSDLDKVAFKLSDYRGKIVLLDFWGNW